MKYSNITISGKICTGKTTLRNLLAKKLGWQTFSTGELFRQYALDHHLNLNTGQEQNNLISRKIDNQVTKMLKEKEKLIIDSWLAGITAQSTSGVLKVLLTCQNHIRYQRFAKREEVSYAEAKNQAEKRFLNWSKKIKEIYHRQDFLDKKNFDLIIDTSYITPQAILKKVLNVLI
jgi:predicted cytidylate kinase